MNKKLLLFVLAVSGSSQTRILRRPPGDARYEVASIKPVRPGQPGFVCGPRFSPVQLTLETCPVKRMIEIAYGLFPYELQSGPAWISSESFTIVAKSSHPAASIDQYTMLQPLLEDRFKLKWHWGKKEMPVFVVSAAERGIKLPLTAPGSCVPFDEKVGPPPPQAGKPPSCGFMLQPQTPDGSGFGINVTGTTMEKFVGNLSILLGRPAIDRTGFTKTFDVHITFARDASLAAWAVRDPPWLVRPPEESGQASDPARWPNVFTVLKGLGLNVRAGRSPVDVFVIDDIQRPAGS